MAKMFYSLEEACAKLAKSEGELKDMIEAGQIQEFRDRDKLMFKVDQVDLLASTEDETSEIHLGLEDSSGASGSGLDLADDSILGLADSREATGISVFDTDHSGEEDVAGDTQVGGTQVGVEAIEDELSLEAIGSGSGLLDLTRESDDTSLGAELLEEVYSGDTAAELPANASGLFEAAGADTADEAVPQGMGGGGAVAMMPMISEVYDGSGSGLGVGMMIGAMVALVCVAIIVIVSIMGSTPMLTELIADKLWMWVGGIGGATVIFGLIGLFIGKATE